MTLRQCSNSNEIFHNFIFYVIISICSAGVRRGEWMGYEERMEENLWDNRHAAVNSAAFGSGECVESRR